MALPISQKWIYKKYFLSIPIILIIGSAVGKVLYWVDYSLNKKIQRKKKITYMIEHHQIPLELKSLLGEEDVQFFVKADKERTTKELWSVIRGGLFWITIIGGIFIAMVYELLLGKPTSLHIGNTYTTISPDDLSPLFGFFTFGFFFVLPGFILIALGVFGFFRKGGYFLGTQSRLLQLNSWNECSVHDWSEFQNKIDLFFTNTKGNLMFTLKETEIIKRGSKKRKKHKIMRMAEIRYAKEIKEFCHEKIANAAI